MDFWWPAPHALRRILDPDVLLRFIKFVEKEAEPRPGMKTCCWKWTGYCCVKGYGRFWYGGRHMLSHRVSYSIFKRRIPKGITVDHRCSNSSCVNPRHLRQRGHVENAMDHNQMGPEPGWDPTPF